jgi:hypothetical protein
VKDTSFKSAFSSFEAPLSTLVLSAPDSHDKEGALPIWKRAYAKWPDLPHFVGVDRIGMLKGKTTWIGFCRCNNCRKNFTVRLSSIFEDVTLSFTCGRKPCTCFARARKASAASPGASAQKESAAPIRHP